MATIRSVSRACKSFRERTPAPETHLSRTSAYVFISVTPPRVALISLTLSSVTGEETFISSALTEPLLSDIFSIAMKNLFKDSRRRFIATSWANLSILLLSAGALSEVFIKFNSSIKFGIICAGVIFFVLAVAIFPNKDDDKEED